MTPAPPLITRLPTSPWGVGVAYHVEVWCPTRRRTLFATAMAEFSDHGVFAIFGEDNMLYWEARDGALWYCGSNDGVMPKSPSPYYSPGYERVSLNWAIYPAIVAVTPVLQGAPHVGATLEDLLRSALQGTS